MYDLNFTPKPEGELFDLLEEGEGNFEVIDAARKESKSSGNPMIELKLKVWDKSGQQGIIYDYLMLTSSNFSLRKIRHFCYSCGLENFYESGKLNAADCINKSGKLKIGFQKGTNGYSDKNIVSDYIHEKSTNAPNDKSKYVPKEEAFDDDIPF